MWPRCSHSDPGCQRKSGRSCSCSGRLEALLRRLGALARANPMLAMFADAHWIDPTSPELLDLTVDRVRHLLVVVAITFRACGAGATSCGS